MSRWKASAIHFSISLLVFLGLLGIILTVWYPGILFRIDGGWAGLRIVFAVDLVLGPLLTLIVYRAGKPGLKFDLSCIVAFQVVCMAGGMWVVYNERPLALVLAHDTFYSLARQEFEDFDKDPALLESFPGSYPKLIYTELPENDIEADIIAIRGQFIGEPLYIQTERYRAIPQEDAASVFRRQELVRTQMTDEIRQQLPPWCLASNFVSAITSGIVCYDAESGALREYFENPMPVEGELPAVDQEPAADGKPAA
jgi:hypothetical protein